MLRHFVLFIAALSLATPAVAQSRSEMRAGRQRGWDAGQVGRWLDFHARSQVASPFADCPDLTNRRDAIMNGNKITTQITNFGSISAPGNSITDIVWNGLGYGYEFGPFVAAEIIDEGHQDPQSVPLLDDAGNPVLDENGEQVWVMHIVSDGLVSNGGELSPDRSEYWGWQPIPCAQPVGNFEGIQVVNPISTKVPTSDDRDTDLDGKPDSWPDDWFNPTIGRYVWPGALKQGASNADKEALYFMNDYRNREFAYDPFPGDDARKGLGLEVEVRYYQWANPLAEDAIFLVYKITNKSEKDLDKVIFGMWGDPHVGGTNNWQDDLAFFDRSLNMVYAWDADGRADIVGRTPGYFGYKFLESPGVGTETIDGVVHPGDGTDNDGDGMVDESWTDGIDNDNDWNSEDHDLGIDGLGNTGDQGEGDGVPTAGDPFDITRPGEPNFEFTDIDESDMIGLTSFASPPFTGNNISNDERVWDLVRPGRFDAVPEDPGDYVFLYGAGDFPLRAGETKRFSIALLVGENLNDLKLNAQTVQQIYDIGYRFAQAPEKPVVTAVPGDRKVTLYWDDRAERSIDPLTDTRDFEGYVIYRSTDYAFEDITTITDINGSAFLSQPLTNQQGVPARFDLENGITGISDIPFQNRGVSYFLGNDTGVYHSYVDSNNVINGQTYYYAVVAYDRGFQGDAGEGFTSGISPTETSKTITFDPYTDTYLFDDNTVSVTPGTRVAGYVPPAIKDDAVQQTAGDGTGAVSIDILDEFAVQDDNEYRVVFEEVEGQAVYSVVNETPVEVTFAASPGGTSSVRYRHITPESFELRTSTGTLLQPGTQYELNADAGVVSIPATGSITGADSLTARFTYAPVFQSTYLQSEEANPVFDGLKIFVQDDVLGVDSVRTGWTNDTQTPFQVEVATAGPGRIPQPYDYEIRFSDTNVSEAIPAGLPVPFEVYNVSKGNQLLEVFVTDANRNDVWDLDERIIFLEDLSAEGGSARTATWQVTFTDPANSERPGAGDVLFVSTRKPFESGDAFTFSTTAARTEPELAQQGMQDIYVVPNPYVATNELEPVNPIDPLARGERRLYFANVPQECTIRIYTLAGELVDTIEHEGALDDGKVFWNLRTKDNMNISYGLYIYHVESAEGTFIGKFAVIK